MTGFLEPSHDARCCLLRLLGNCSHHRLRSPVVVVVADVPPPLRSRTNNVVDIRSGHRLRLPVVIVVVARLRTDNVVAIVVVRSGHCLR